MSETGSVVRVPIQQFQISSTDMVGMQHTELFSATTPSIDHTPHTTHSVTGAAIRTFPETLVPSVSHGQNQTPMEKNHTPMEKNSMEKEDPNKLFLKGKNQKSTEDVSQKTIQDNSINAIADATKESVCFLTFIFQCCFDAYGHTHTQYT